ncbi:hypothetical protein [Mitsuaria sp. GD03876]|uniref:hypothetical protein n=1 Tax=Mitsuaria sp. GD03876 TaxID=2975399 RepID=UPI002448468D|nr:hypothetical protein [Mitsuaria sp. GD03876]MDH0865776.1 hypothetical protein [Mitsuaria sp. GD03876]
MSASTLPALSVLASGLVTCLGFNGPASLAAMRAGVRHVRLTNLWDASAGEYVAAGKVDLPQWWPGAGKLADLVAPAIGECLKAATDATRTEARRIPLFLVLPRPDRPHLQARLDERLLEEIGFKLGLPLHPDSRLFPADRAATVSALVAARQWLSDSAEPYCVIAGVDSLIEPKLVDELLSRRRILSGDNSNGFSPGEAASAVLVGREGHGFADELQILGWGSGHEPATPDSEVPLRGDGLIEAIGQALQASGLSMQESHFRISDLNGEHDRFKEMTFAMLRYERHPRPLLNELWHPVEHVGEVGAAIGPLLLAVALHAGQRDYGVGSTALCTLSNDDGARACVVTRFRRLAGHLPAGSPR